MKKISLIIPCYNEGTNVELLYKELSQIMDKLIRQYEFEILFINDGSSDHTLDVLKLLAKQHTNVKYISFSRNFGKEAAMYCGFKNVTGDLVAVMDADMQDPPSLLPEMLTYIESGDYDSVATRRVSRNGEPIIRSFFARRFYKLMHSIADTDVVDGARDFRLMNRAMVDAIIEIGEYNRFSKGIFGWIGFRTKWLEYENKQRVAGESKWSFWGLVKYSLDGIMNYSQVPLMLASWLGILMTLVAFIFTGFIVVKMLVWGDPVQGWASLMCVTLFLGGVQLFSMGILGQYLAKTYMEVKKRPHYIIAERN